MPALIKVSDLFDMFNGIRTCWNNRDLIFVFQDRKSEIHLHSTARIDDNIETEIYEVLKDCSILKAMDFLVDSNKYYIICSLSMLYEKDWKRALELANKNNCKHPLRKR